MRLSMAKMASPNISGTHLNTNSRALWSFKFCIDMIYKNRCMLASSDCHL